MNRHLVAPLVSLVLFFAPSRGTLAASDSPGSKPAVKLSATDRQNLAKIVAEVREAILTVDVKALLRHISQFEPLVCTDTAYSYREVERFLQRRDSHLYMSLFDSARFAASCRAEYSADDPAISDKEFLATASPGVELVALDARWAGATITSAVKGRAAMQWFFHKESGGWKLAGGSFVLGRCSCG